MFNLGQLFSFAYGLRPKRQTYLIMKYFLLLLLGASLWSCDTAKTKTEKDLSAQEIVDKAIAKAGGAVIANAAIHFKFRDYYYKATRQNGVRTLERCTDAECQHQQDVLRSDGSFERFRESARLQLSDSLQQLYGNSVNSVHYFSVLPYGLNDPAVKKSLIGEHRVKEQPYYLIKVQFAEDGGGEDFQDQYLYWIHKTTFAVDYLAYNYQTNEGGTRFRAAYNPRRIEGIRFVDYKNYKPARQFPPLTSLDSLFENNKLELLSTIALEDIKVMPCPEC